MDESLNGIASSCVRRHHHSGGGGKYAPLTATIELPRGDELERLYRRLARDHAMEMAADMRSLLRDNKQPASNSSPTPVATEEHMVRTVCEYYIAFFRTLFIESFEFKSRTSETTSSAASGRKDVRKNFSDSNFYSTLAGRRKASGSGLTMRLDESWMKSGLVRKLSVDDEVFLKDTEAKKKQPQLKRWYSRVGGMKRVDDVTTTTTEGCLNDPTNKSGVITSVWNRFRRGSKSSSGCVGSKNGHDVMKLERTSEFRISSSGCGVIISPFLKARILLRQLGGGLYQIEIYCPVKSLKPKHVIYGYDIVEARPTAASKIAESSRCFVLKTNEQEFVIKLDTPDDVLVWLTEIEEANMRSPNPKPHIYECYKHPYTPEFLKKHNNCHQSPTSTQHQQQQGNNSDSNPSLTASKKQNKSAYNIITNTNNLMTNINNTPLNGNGRPGCGRSLETRWNNVPMNRHQVVDVGGGCHDNSRSSSATPAATSSLVPRTKIIIGNWDTALQIFAPHEPRPATAERRDSNDEYGSVSPSTSTASSLVDVESSIADAEENSGSSGCSSSSNGSNSSSGSVTVEMTLLPWFHGHMSRGEASSLATQLDDGVFLLRYSANQQCHVITIAYQGKAKHLRLTIDSEGRCRVNDKTFSTVMKMLVFHHKFPLLVDASASTNASRVLLTDYVINKMKFGAGDYDYVKPHGKLTSSSGGAPCIYTTTLLEQEPRETALAASSDGADVIKPTTTTDEHLSRVACGGKSGGGGEVNGGECSRGGYTPSSPTFEERVVAQHVGKVGI